MSLKGNHESNLRGFHALSLTESSVNLWARWGISREEMSCDDSSERDFGERGDEKKKVRMTSHQIWKHSPIFPSLIFYLVNFSQILYSLLHFSAYPEGIWILFWLWSAKIMHSHLEFHTNKSIPPTKGWNKQFFWYTKLEEIYHLKGGVHNNSAIIIAEIKIFWLKSNWQL